MTRELTSFGSKWVTYLTVAAVFALTSCASTPTSALPTGPKKGSKEERAALLVDSAQGSLMEKDPIGALQYLKAAEEIAPNLPSIYHMRALAFQMRKMPDEALQEMKRAVTLDPKNSYATNTYGKFLMDAGKTAEAETYLTKAAEDATFRESYKARTSLGILYYRQGRIEEAEKNLNYAINDDAANACIAYYYRGHILVKKGSLMEATKMYDKASSKLCSAFVDAHYALGLVYEKSRKYELARKKFLDINQNFPESSYSEQAMQRLKSIP